MCVAEISVCISERGPEHWDELDTIRRVRARDGTWICEGWSNLHW